MTSWVYNNVIGLWYHIGYLFRNGFVCIVRRCKLLNPENISGYHQINKIGEFLQLSSKRKGIRAWNFRMMIRKIWRFLWYQNRNNFEKKRKKKGPSSFNDARFSSITCCTRFPYKSTVNIILWTPLYTCWSSPKTARNVLIYLPTEFSGFLQAGTN